MRDDTGVRADDALEIREGEAILLRERRARRCRPGGYAVMLLGGSSADTMLAGFVLNECEDVLRIETIANVDAATARLTSGRRFDLVLIDCDDDTGDLNATAAQLSAASGEHGPLLVLLASRFAPAQIAASPPGGPFAARLAKPLFRGRCEHLFRRLFS